MTHGNATSTVTGVRASAIAAACFAVMIAGVGIVGSAAGWTGLQDVAGDDAAMHAGSAVAIMIGAIAILALCLPMRVAHQRGIQVASAGLIFTIGVLSLLHNAAHWIPSLDSTIVQLSPRSAARGEMAASTAICVGLLAVIVAFFDVRMRRSPRSVEWLALVLIAISLVRWTGFLFGLRSTDGADGFYEMSLHSAAAFVALGYAALAGRPDGPLVTVIRSSSPGGRMFRRIVPLTAVIVILLAWARVEGQKRGWFSMELGITLSATASLAMIIAIVWWQAVMADRFDDQRRVAEEQRRTAIQELAAKQELLQAVIDTASDGVIVADANGRFVEWNPAATRLIGLGASDQPIGEWSAHYGVFSDAGTTPFKSEDLALALALKGEVVEDQEQFIRNASQPEGRWISVSATPMFTSAGAIRGGVVILRDVHLRKAAEQQLLFTKDQLERQVEERTAELVRSNEELKHFAYVASHDLQEPLRMVSSYVELLARRYSGKLDADADEFINFAVDGANRMKQLINDLLQYSRIGTKVGEKRATESDDVFSHVLDNLKVQIEECRAQVTREGLPTVHVDPRQFLQLLQNLISNSIKFHGEKPARIHVSARRDAGAWVFSVRDNGIGLDPKYAERIFGMFQRLHTREEYPGTGIGLAICRKIVERHGGTIRVESQPGQGATFIFTIPDSEGQTHDLARHAA